MATLVGQQGWAVTSIAQVIERAGVSRKTFYEYFPDKLACFLEAYREVTEPLVARLSRAEGGGARRTRTQVLGYLEAISQDPVVARACIVEVLHAGPAALLARDEVNRRFADLVFGHRSKDPLVRRALIGGVNDVVTTELLAGRTDVRRLGPSLLAFARR
ncbi:MAG: TetR/AcrR family transcriptional regulator [Myxococcaceae bacterium]|jgi:AcrR family transcriptional regulator|nr:TetR/AcrR family transcriptional regulator [Myxococcaceae bacterium]MCA3015730.1 TetR/AcrR family transcriptional regulator [Myxococcaceae bacterium]